MLTDAQWQSLCELVGRTDLVEVGFKTAQVRVRHVEEVEAVVKTWIAGRTPIEAMHLLQAAGIPAGAVQNSRELLDDDPQLAARGYWQRLDHPEMGITRFTSPPYLVDSERVELKRPPLLGEHTNFVLESVLGYTPDHVAKLRSEGVLS